MNKPEARSDLQILADTLEPLQILHQRRSPGKVRELVWSAIKALKEAVIADTTP